MLTVAFLFLFLSLNTNYAFDAGFLQLKPLLEKDADTTHYSITVCALCRVTIDYVKTVYKVDTTYLETRFNEINGQCQGNIVSDIINILNNPQTLGASAWQFSTTVKTIASANTKTDLKELFEEDSHFDSETFFGGSQLVLTRYKAALDDILEGGNYDQARKTFGEMLHTLQDFYSHTNFIELGYTSPNDVLGQRIFSENEYASINMRTCINCEKGDCQTKPNIDENILKNKILTSGYFIPIGWSIFHKNKPKGKCSHGGFFDSTSSDEPKGGISKDKLSASHGNLHYRASNMAYQATVKILNQFRNDIGNDAFGLFLALKKNLNSLIISIDTACSMIDYIELAKDISYDIINQYRQFKYAPYNYILVTFNNNNAQLIVNSEDPKDLTDAIRNINSCEKTNSTLGEMYYHGLVEGLKYSEYGSVIYTFTDSPARDGYLKNQARALLRSKRAVIYSFLNQKMARRVYQAYFNVVDPLDGSDNDTDLATISGGLTFPIFMTDRSVISEFIFCRLEWTRLQSLFMYKSKSDSSEFYVDSSIDELHLDISSMDEITNINGIELRMPNNSLYPIEKIFNNTKHLYIWKILQPTPGAWRLTTSNLVSTKFTYDVQIQGKTSIICSSTLQKEMESDTDTNGYTQLTTEPIIDSNLIVLTTCGDLSLTDLNVSLITQSGSILASYSPFQLDPFGTLTRIRVPKDQFRIQTTITLKNGTRIQRIEKQLISPTIFSIELRNPPYIVSSGETITMNYSITSTSIDPVSIRLQIIDTLKLLGNDGLEKELTFINETYESETVTLLNVNQSKFMTSLLIFSVSTLNNQTKKFSYENDDIAAIYLESNSPSIITTMNPFIILLFSLLYYIGLSMIHI